MSTTDRPRERSVPCLRCGVTRVRGKLRPKTLTFNRNAVCDAHGPRVTV